MADEEPVERESFLRLATPRQAASTPTPADALEREQTPVDEDRAALDPLCFPPLPLVSGTGLEGPDGTLKPVASVAVVITATDGTRRVVDLAPRYGGWWPPKDG